MTLSNYIKIFLSRFDTHMQEVLRGASIAFALKILAAGLAFLLNVALARLLGAEGAGIFFLAFTIVLIISAISRIGMESTLLKFIAVNSAKNKPEKVLGVYQKAMLYSLTMAAISSVLLYLLAPWISQAIFSKPKLAHPLAIMAFTIAPLTLFTLHSYALQGMKKIAASILILSVISPLMTSIISISFVPEYGIDAAVWGYLCATIVTLLIARWFWKKSTQFFKVCNAKFNSRELLSCSIPMFGIVMMNMIINWSPILLLGIWESSENVGIYNAASRTAFLTNFVLLAVNSIASPKFAALYQQKKIETLAKLVNNSVKFMALLAFPILLTFIVFPERVMMIFGEQFKQGTTVLYILAIGQFVNVLTGLAGYLLIMSGYEQLMFKNLLINSSLGVLLNLWLIPNYGIIGAAITTALILSTQNIISIFFVWKKLNILLFPQCNYRPKS